MITGGRRTRKTEKGAGLAPGETEGRPAWWRRWPVVSKWPHRRGREKRPQGVASRKLGVIRTRVGRTSVRPSSLLSASALLPIPLGSNPVLAKRAAFLPGKIACSWKARRGSRFSSFLNSHIPFLYFSGSLLVFDCWYLRASLNIAPFLNYKLYERRIFYLLPQCPNGSGQSLTYIWFSISNE